MYTIGITQHNAQTVTRHTVVKFETLKIACNIGTNKRHPECIGLLHNRVIEFFSVPN